VAGVWCVVGAARSIGSISVVMVKGKAYGNNPHSEDNVDQKKMHSGYGVLVFTSDRGVAGGAGGAAALGGRVQGAGEMVGKINILILKKCYFLQSTNFKLLSQMK
jgi:hypothetical protein